MKALIRLRLGRGVLRKPKGQAEPVTPVFRLGMLVDWLLIPIFLTFFTTRLIPEPVADRSIYESVAERLIAGDRLYVDVIDNKDPLFYYAVAAQRLLGPVAEYGFELAWVLGSSLIAAGLACRYYPSSRYGHRVVLVGTAFMLTGLHYDLGGSIPLGIFLTLVTIWLAAAQRPVAAGISLAALLFTKLIYAPIALTFVVVHALAGSDENEPTGKILGRCGAACAVVSVAILLFLFSRDELHGYLVIQQENLFYSANNVFSASTFLGNLANHIRTALYFGKAILAVSLAAFLYLLYQFMCGSAEGALQRFMAACLAIYPVSLAVVCLTMIWGPHLAVLHVFLALAAAATISRLLSEGRWFIAGPVVLGMGWVLSGAGPGNWLAADPLAFPERLEDLGAPPPEAVALHQVAGARPVRYARFGSDNDLHHASGTRSDALACPRFFQYRFTEARLLDSTLACASRADYLIVDFPEDEPLEPGTFVTPVADYPELNRRWRRFTDQAESLLQRDFRCVPIDETLRICRRLRARQLPG